eukprot:IDg19136t1
MRSANIFCVTKTSGRCAEPALDDPPFLAAHACMGLRRVIRYDVHVLRRWRLKKE